MNSQSINERAEEMLAVANAPWKTGAAGMFIIGLAFLISIVNASNDAPSQFVGLTLQLFIFVGLGLLLYHVGQQVHALNRNVILMNGMDMSKDKSTDG